MKKRSNSNWELKVSSWLETNKKILAKQSQYGMRCTKTPVNRDRPRKVTPVAATTYQTLQDLKIPEVKTQLGSVIEKV